MTHDWWSKRLLAKAGVFPPSGIKPSELHAKIAKIERIRKWLWRHALPRLLMGSFRYEGRESDGKSYDEKAREGRAKTYGQRMEEKIVLYNATGNQEYLTDIYNYVLLEVLQPTHPFAHFESTERYD